MRAALSPANFPAGESEEAVLSRLTDLPRPFTMCIWRGFVILCPSHTYSLPLWDVEASVPFCYSITAFLVILKEEVGSYRAANNEEETAQSLRENIQLVHHNQCLAIQRICRGIPDTRTGEIKISSGAVDLANADATTKANKTNRAGREKELKHRRGPMPTATNQHLQSGNAFQSVSVSVALLLLGMGSVAPLGAVTVAVSDRSGR